MICSRLVEKSFLIHFSQVIQSIFKQFIVVPLTVHLYHLTIFFISLVFHIEEPDRNYFDTFLAFHLAF